MHEVVIYAGSIAFYWLLLATAQVKGQLDGNYVGCFVDIALDPTLEPVLENQENLTIEICIQECYNKAIQTKFPTFAALNNGRSCICRNNRGQQLHDWYCNVKCSGDQTQNCGGDNNSTFYSLYSVCEFGYYGYKCDQVCHCKGQAPCDRVTGRCPNGCEEKWFGTTCSSTLLSGKYIGCFRDSQRRAISQEYDLTGQMTVEFCSTTCILQNNSFAGLQARWHCFCGEDYAKYGPRSESDCSDPCAGNQWQKCGGPWANSVYSVCPIGFYGRNCVNQCHCSDEGSCRFNGSCLNSSVIPCKPGWTGASCNVRDCEINNGDCEPDEICDSVDLGFANLSVCRCKDGLHRDMCTPNFDECQMGTSTCNLRTEVCVNNIGSYRCECKTGFENRSGNCEDKDECRNVSLVCNIETELCTNTIGSYTCRCKYGYENTTFGNCTDVDECKSGASKCDPTSEECVNTNGSYRCKCKDGFVNIYGQCEDMDECKGESVVCDIGSELCQNTVGSYVCNCKSGFENTTSGKCIDIDECQLNSPSPCNTFSECFNGIGNYTCKCKENFVCGKYEGVHNNDKECNNSNTTGIILGIFLAISLLINALFAVYLLNKARNSEFSKGLAQSNSQRGSNRLWEQEENIYDGTREPFDQDAISEEIVLKKRQVIFKPTSEYALLTQDD